jgi:hypothetical protein
MNELRERFNDIVSELIASYRNIHYEDMATKERIGCLVGRAQTIAISLMEQYNDAHTQEESMFLADEFMGVLSDNTKLNELKFDAYVKYRRLHLGYLSDIKTAPKNIIIRKKLESISDIRKKLNIVLEDFIKLQEFPLPKKYADDIHKIRMYIDKLTVIMGEYAKLLPSNNGGTNRRPNNKRPNNRSVNAKNRKANLIQGTNLKGTNIKGTSLNLVPNVRPNVGVKVRPVIRPVVKPRAVTRQNKSPANKKTAKKPPLNMKQELNKLKEYAQKKLIEFDTTEHSKTEIKRIYDKIVEHHFKLVSKNEYLNSIDTPLHAEYLVILEEIEFTMRQINSLLE